MHCSLPHMFLRQYVLLSMPAKQALPDHNLERGKGTLDFLSVPQTSKMCNSGKGNVFIQRAQLAASHADSRLTDADSLRLVLPPNCKARSWQKKISSSFLLNFVKIHPFHRAPVPKEHRELL